MKIAVLNFSGNVGKSTIARHLLSPRMPKAGLVAVETITVTEPGVPSGFSNEEWKAKLHQSEGYLEKTRDHGYQPKL